MASKESAYAASDAFEIIWNAYKYPLKNYYRNVRKKMRYRFENMKGESHQQAGILSHRRRICVQVERPGSGRSFVSVRVLSVSMTRAGY